ncbi:hypothetical protein [Marinobacter salexigens]|uniref:Uncharacterized protein n=1 Tax=Marinobacter salexigens TaxID=1925763 RepID=A0ABS6A6V6_9GAMM|nr:hypothetical protein [Marinobacter salexigens]MBU2873460.1 hypothetical protein [Marinobacter salexigens]
MPHNLGTLPITRKKPKLASRIHNDLAGLGHDAKPETTTRFAAKAHAPSHQKTTEALAYNAKHSGVSLRASGGQRPHTAAPCYE